MLGNSSLAVVGNVAHGDAPFPGSLHVNGVVAGGQGSHVPQLGELGKLLLPQSDPVEDHDVGVFGPLHGQVLRGLPVDGEFPRRSRGSQDRSPGLVVPPSNTTMFNTIPPHLSIIMP